MTIKSKIIELLNIEDVAEQFICEHFIDNIETCEIHDPDEVYVFMTTNDLVVTWVSTRQIDDRLRVTYEFTDGSETTHVAFMGTVEPRVGVDYEGYMFVNLV